MSATAPTKPATPTPTEKNSKTINARPATNRKYATHGESSVCASCALETELAEVDLARRLAHLRAVQLDDLDRRQLHRAARGLDRPAVEQPDELEQRRRLRGHVLQRRVDGERRVVVADRVDRTEMRARRDRGEVGRAREQRGRAARAAAGRPDPHRDRHGRVREVVRATRSTSMSIAPDASSWNTTTDECTRSASRNDERMSAAFAGSIKPLTCTTSMRPVAHVLRAGDRAERRQRSARSRPAPREDDATARVSRSTRLVRWSNGGGRFLLDLPRRHRRRQGRRREDHRHGRARRHRGPRRPVGADRRGRGQVGPARDVRRARARLRRDRPRARRSGPASSRPTPRSSTTSSSHGMKRISKRLAASGALDVVATAVPGMKDILVLGKVKSIEESRAADLVIVDAPAAGHAVTFLLSARGLLDAVRVGPIRKQAQDVVSLISDPERCQVMLVTLRRGDAGERSRSTPRSRSRTAPVSRSDRSSSTGASRRCRSRSPRTRPRSSTTRAPCDRFVSATRSRRPRARGRVPRGTTRAPARTDRTAPRAAAAAADRAAVRVQPRHHPRATRHARRRVHARNRAAVTIRIDELVDDRRVVICCGTGGVGKTTTAAVLALEGARRGPQRVRRDDRSRAPARRRARHRAPHQRSDRDRPRAVGRHRRRRATTSFRAVACRR